jgi:hypothetical protein
MLERVHPRWPTDRPTGVHHIQARHAFEQGAAAYLARLLVVVDGIALVERLPDATTTALIIARPDRLTAILARGDLTTLGGSPLALVSESRGILGIATGPAEPPQQLRVWSNVSRLEEGEAVEIPAADEEQPSLQLLAARGA